MCFHTHTLDQHRAREKRERKKDILMYFKRPKWRIKPNKRLHLKVVLSLRTTN